MKNVGKTGCFHLLFLILLMFVAGNGNSQTTQVRGKDEANETVEVVSSDIPAEFFGVQKEKADEEETDKRIVCFYRTLQIKVPIKQLKRNTSVGRIYYTNRIFFLLHTDLPPPPSDLCFA